MTTGTSHLHQQQQFLHSSALLSVSVFFAFLMATADASAAAAAAAAAVDAAAARDPPRVLPNYQRRHLVLEGDPLRLTCPVESSTRPFIEWQKDGEVVHIGWSHFVLKDSVLRVKELRLEDTGVYVCRATNGFGTVEALFQIYVYGNEIKGSDAQQIDFDQYFKNSFGLEEMPFFLLPEQMKDDYSVQLVGETVRLCCLATGKPMPVIVWYKNGLILPEDTDSSDSSEGGTSLWQLKLPSVKVTDSGRYTCKVFNRIGTINFTYTVQVIDSKPVIQDIQNSTVTVGDALVLQCLIHSKEQPTVQWLKRFDLPIHRFKEQNRTITMNNERFVVIHPGGETISTKRHTYLNKLILNAVNEDDGGVYVCSCATVHGTAAEFRSTFVTVLPDAVLSYDDIEDTDQDASAANAFLPIVVALTATITIFFLLVVVVVAAAVHRRRSGGGGAGGGGGGGEREAQSSMLSRPPTMSSSLTSQSVEKSQDNQTQHSICLLLQPPLKRHLDHVLHPSTNHITDQDDDHSFFLNSSIHSTKPPFAHSYQHLHNNHQFLNHHRHHYHHHHHHTHSQRSHNERRPPPPPLPPSHWPFF